MKTRSENLRKPVLPPRGYYVPMVLANGEDFCQVDFTGSMGWRDNVKKYMSFWYKKGRPNSWHERGIAKLKYDFTSELGPIFLGDFSQDFDPLTAILKTRISGYQLEMEIETFLSADHTLVEIYRILKSGSRSSTLTYSIAFPDRSNTGNTILVLDGNAHETLCLENGVQSFRYAYKDEEEEFSGLGLSGMRVFEGTAQIKTSPEAATIEITNLGGGDRFVRVSTLMDSINGAGYEAEARKIHSAYMAESEAKLLGDHVFRYSKYSQASSFTCSDREIEELFDTAQYVCGAAIHPNGSAVTSLEMPNNHGMGTYMDVWYTHAALLRANRVDEAMKIIRFWDSVYPKAKKIAQEAGVGGARFEWLLRYDGTPYLPGITEQIHNNVIPVVNIYEQYLYTGEKAILSKRFELMQDCVRFVVEFALRKNPATGKTYMREIQGCDEYDTRKINDLLTTAVTRKAIWIITQCAEIIGRKPEGFISDTATALDGILQGLKKDDIYMIRDGVTLGSWAHLMTYIHYPEPEVFGRVQNLVMDTCRTEHGVHVGAVGKSITATCPWMEGLFAWSAALNNSRDAMKYLKMMTRFTNYYGGLCEVLFVYGEPSRDWFVAAHGVFIAALVDTLIRRDGDKITVFPCGTENLPEKISFSNFRLPGEILASVKYGEGLSVKLENLSWTGQKIIVEVGGHSETVVIEGKSSQSVIFPENLYSQGQRI